MIANSRWRNIGRFSGREVESLVDERLSLWANGESTSGGENNCVTPEAAAQSGYSLALIKPADLRIRVGQRKSLRACFSWYGISYSLKVTDPVARAGFQWKTARDYPVDAYLCISLTEPFQGDNRCHKLAAGLIGVDK